jgi:uncharacterized protein
MQAILIGSWNVDKIYKISAQISKGVPLTINEPAYTYTKLAEKRVDMLAKGTKDPRARARAIALEAGGWIGVITNADTGTSRSLPPTPRKPVILVPMTPARSTRTSPQ